MAHGKSLELQSIPKRTREWVHQHSVPDTLIGGKPHPTTANRAERRAAERGKPWHGAQSARTARAVKTTLRRGPSAGVSNG